MVFLGSSIEFPIVYTHSPRCRSACRDEFAPVINTDGETRLFGNNMNQDHLGAVADWVNNARIKPLDNFSLNDLPHIRIEMSLRLTGRSSLLLHKYMVSAIGGTNASQIRKRPSNGYLMFN
jgi:hypothetical protein